MTFQIGYSGSTDVGSIIGHDRVNYIYDKCSSWGILDKFYCLFNLASGNYFRGAVYLSSNRELVAQTESTHITTNSKEWVSTNFGPSSVASGETYLIVVWCDYEGGTCYEFRNSVAGESYFYDSKDYSSYDDGNYDLHFNPLDDQSNYSKISGYQIRMYATATETAIPVEISSASGCVALTPSSATVSAKVTRGSGNCYIYWESGSGGGGTTKSNWDNNESLGLKEDGDYFTTKLTNLTSGWTYSYRGYISSNGWGGGEDWTENQTFTVPHFPHNLLIYYSCNQYPDYYINCPCHRWDETDYDIVIETTLTSSQRNALFSNLVPGEIYEYSNVLGWRVFKDRTYNSGNSLYLVPKLGLSGLRESRNVVVKEISDSFRNKDCFLVKLDCKRIRDFSDYD